MSSLDAQGEPRVRTIRIIHPLTRATMDHTLRPSGHTRRRVLVVLAFFASSAAVAFALSIGLREMLPYEALKRHTAEERFFLWEGVAWMLGLAMILMGGSAGIGTLDLVHGRIPHYLQLHHFARDMQPQPYRFSPVPWWVVCTGTALLALAIHARAQLPG